MMCSNIILFLALTGIAIVSGANVAFNKTATQTSDLDPLTSADRVVDGCTNKVPIAGCCSSTGAGTANELTIALGQQYDIGQIKVYGDPSGEDELSGFTLYGWSKTLRIPQLLYNNYGTAYDTGVFEIMIEPSLLIKEITVKRPTATNFSLTVCEIQAYEVCPQGTYGDSCGMICGNCLNDTACNWISGRCAEGCAVGWGGDVCKTAESRGTIVGEGVVPTAFIIGIAVMFATHD